MKLAYAIIVLSLVLINGVTAQETDSVESATRRGLARVKQAATDWQGNRTCFSCHHQTLPMLAALEADRVGFALDKAWFQSQADTTYAYFAERIDDMDDGEHVPGGAATTGFGFWALSLAERPPDETTASMIKYLLQIQGVSRLRDTKADASIEAKPAKKTNGHWQASCRRAPMQASLVGDTVLVLLGIEKYATPEQRPQVETARAAAEHWLSQTPIRDHQDRLWRLWGLHYLDGNASVVKDTLAAILSEQRDDGGWSETKDRSTDSYSTGQTLFMLLKIGVAKDHPAIIRARDYLLKTQFADGSWLAESHVSFKAQRYFENGDPHGEHQFLSTAATAWATAGLAQLLPQNGIGDK